VRTWWNITEHAVHRYRERYRPGPGVTLRAARREMLELLSRATWTGEYGNGRVFVADGVRFIVAMKSPTVISVHPRQDIANHPRLRAP
jgi:hypothetical protein